jgi:hypothetical protein
MVKDWTNIQKKYKGLWVALADDDKTVLGSGKTLREALVQAKDKTDKTPFVTRMPIEIVPFVGVL